MRLAIINKTSGGMSGGYRKYLHEILPRIATSDKVEAVFCAVPDALRIQDWFCPLPRVRFEKYKPFLNYFNDIELRSELKLFSPDIIFSPIERHFHYKNIPVVTMLQNMEPFVKRSILNTFKINLRLEAQKLIGRKALKGSDGIICISNFVKYFLINDLNIPKRRTSLIYHGIGLYDANPKRMQTLPKGFNHNFILVFTFGHSGVNDNIIKRVYYCIYSKEKIFRQRIHISIRCAHDSNGSASSLWSME